MSLSIFNHLAAVQQLLIIILRHISKSGKVGSNHLLDFVAFCQRHRETTADLIGIFEGRYLGNLKAL